MTTSLTNAWPPWLSWEVAHESTEGHRSHSCGKTVSLRTQSHRPPAFSWCHVWKSQIINTSDTHPPVSACVEWQHTHCTTSHITSHSEEETHIPLHKAFTVHTTWTRGSSALDKPSVVQSEHYHLCNCITNLHHFTDVVTLDSSLWPTVTFDSERLCSTRQGHQPKHIVKDTVWPLVHLWDYGLTQGMTGRQQQAWSTALD